MTDVTHIVNLEEGYFKVNFSFLFPIIKHKTKSRTHLPSCPMSLLLACTMQPFAHSHDMQRIAPDSASHCWTDLYAAGTITGPNYHPCKSWLDPTSANLI